MIGIADACWHSLRNILMQIFWKKVISSQIQASISLHLMEMLSSTLSILINYHWLKHLRYSVFMKTQTLLSRIKNHRRLWTQFWAFNLVSEEELEVRHQMKLSWKELNYWRKDFLLFLINLLERKSYSRPINKAWFLHSQLYFFKK